MRMSFYSRPFAPRTHHHGAIQGATPAADRRALRRRCEMEAAANVPTARETNSALPDLQCYIGLALALPPGHQQQHAFAPRLSRIGNALLDVGRSAHRL